MKIIDKMIEKLYFKQPNNLALYDQLTGVYNHNWLLRVGSKQLKKREVFVYVVDINGLKEINDNHGHVNGDKLIREVVKRLRDVVEENGIIVRYGGDEFIIFSWKNHLKKLMSVTSVSFGVTLKLEGESVKKAIERAVIKMYHNKRRLKEERR